MYKMSIIMLGLMLAFATIASAQQVPAPPGPPAENPQGQMNAPRHPMGMGQYQGQFAPHRPMNDYRYPDRHFAWENHPHRGGAILLGVCLIINILLTVWVFQDMRQRNAGSGLWIPIVLLSGFFGALLYGVARLGDIRNK